MFADIIERRKHEGDFQGAWRPAAKGTDGASYWLRRGLALFTLVVGTVLVFALVVSGRKGQTPPSPDLPVKRAIDAPPPVTPGKPPPVWKGSMAAEAAPGAIGTGEAEAPPPASSDKPRPRPERPAPEPATAAAGEDIVRSEGRFVFRPMLPEFKPLQELDRNFIEDHAWDDTRWPDEASDIKKEPEAVEHIFRFIRTHGTDLRLRADPKLTHADMLKEPGIHRGKVIRTRVLVVKKYMNFGWSKNDSGVQDTTMLFCYPTNATFGRAIFVILTSQPPEDFREEELYDLTGVFWKRYPYVNAKNEWQWQPLILTMQMTPAPPPAAVSRKVAVGIIIVAAVLIIGLLFLVRGETREGEAKRKARIERRRRQQPLPPSPRGNGLAPLQPAGDLHEPPAAPPPPPAEDKKPDDPYTQAK